MPPRNNDAVDAHSGVYIRATSAGTYRNTFQLPEAVIAQLRDIGLYNAPPIVFPGCMFDSTSGSFEIVTEEPVGELTADGSEELDNFLKEFVLRGDVRNR